MGPGDLHDIFLPLDFPTKKIYNNNNNNNSIIKQISQYDKKNLNVITISIIVCFCEYRSGPIISFDILNPEVQRRRFNEVRNFLKICMINPPKNIKTSLYFLGWPCLIGR